MHSGLTLTHDMLLVLGLLAFTVLMLVLEWIRADLVALLIVVVIGITRLIPVEQLFEGFAGNAVISLLGVMIMGAGLDRTGVLNKAASFILRLVERRRIALEFLHQRDGRRDVVDHAEPGAAALFLPVTSRVVRAHRRAAESAAAADGVLHPRRHQHRR